MNLRELNDEIVSARAESELSRMEPEQAGRVNDESE